MSVNYKNILRLTRGSLPRFVSQSKDGWLNEALPQTFLAGRMMRRMKREDGGGTSIDFDVQLSTAAPPQWVGPYEKLEIKTTPAPERGSVDWRFLQDRWGISKQEIDLNQGARIVVIKILDHAKETISTAAVTELENVLIAKDGNQDHDGQGSSFKKPLGLKYWATIHGRHIRDGDGSLTLNVGGISPNTYSDWRNPFINPLTSSDLGTRGKIVHGRDLGQGLERIAASMRFDSADVWGKMAKDIKKAPKYDPDKSGQTPEDLLIVTDYETNITYREVLFEARDNVGRDQNRGRPTWKGVPVDWDTKLGFGANGYAKDANGNTLWTDADTDYAPGVFVNGGEVFFINTRFFRMSVHKDNDPYVKDPYEPEGQMAMAFEWTFWLQTWARSRRRGLGYIAGFLNDL